MTRASPPIDVYTPEPAVVEASEALTSLERFFHLRLASGRPLGHVPGQFVQVSLPGFGEAPISISSSPSRGDGFDLVVRRVGNVTSAMHRLQVGDRIGIRGPFGTHFPVDDFLRGRDVLFICGGIGLVPVRSAIQYVLDHRADYGKVTILFGTKTPADRLFVEEAATWAQAPQCQYLETVDRGQPDWTGHVGVITTLMPGLDLDPQRTAVIVCGPPIMYKFVIIELRKMKVPDSHVFLSLERHMKCGVGKCGHCQINGLYTCRDGAVFPLVEVTEVQEAL